MIKKAILVSLIAGTLFASENFTTTVTNGSMRIAAAGTSQAVPVTNGMVVTQGTLYYSTNNLVYMAVAGGTITNMPSHTTGDSLSTPTMRCYPVLNQPRVTMKRVVIWVDNQGTNRVWLTTGGGVAASGKGIRLDPGERIWMGTWRSVEAVTESGNSIVATQEIY